MLSDQLCVVSWRARHGSFVDLMTLYESNYIRLGGLVGDVRDLAGTRRSHPAADCELRLDVLERGPYTTMLQLTYAFGGGDEFPDAPDLAVRIYHDARVAEAHGVGTTPGHATSRRVDGDGLEARWARNVMLNKWLEYLADRGHCLGAAGR
ncbi:MAG: DUF1249 domain-containing protein [Proteobacteria bacterium]|nr:DUF1249 domain-containing protein [Pseudomonadota bacterium]